MPPKRRLYQFHRGSQMPQLETRSQKAHRMKKKKELAAEFSDIASTSSTNNPLPRFQEATDTSVFEHDENDPQQQDNQPDLPDEMRPEDIESLKKIRSHHQACIQQQKMRNWDDLMSTLFPAYLHLKKQTNNWSLPCSLDNFSKDLCKCTSEQKHLREVDLIDIMGQERTKISFCSCIPDSMHILAQGYLSSTPVFPQTAFSLRLLNFYDLLWNICNSHLTPFTEVIRRWNESRLMKLCGKETKKPRELRRCFSGSVDAYRRLKRMEKDLIQKSTSISSQDILAQRSCPACFGVSLPVSNESQPKDTNKFPRAAKNHLPLQTPDLFIPPEEIKAANDEILTHERAQKKTQKAANRCTEQHKAADDRRNSSTWKGCDDTGIFGCCCRHDSVIYFCNIHKSGEGRGLPMSILKHLLGDLDSNAQLRILYDIGCTLGKFFESRKLLTEHLPRMKFATAVFHSYVHDWPCQLQFNPRYNEGWGLTDGEGMERLWSGLSPLVGPLRYATQNHRLGALNHRGEFHNSLGMEKLLLTLKRKICNAITNQKHAQLKLNKLLCQPNPHVQGTFFTVEFFRAQWQSQRNFQINQNQEEVTQKEDQAQFFERGETLKSLAETFVTGLQKETHLDTAQMMNLLRDVQQLQAKQEAEAEKLGPYFGAIEPDNKDQQRRLGLLWSAKAALYKAAVEIQGEMQPLRDSKARGDRLGTVLKEKIFDALKRRKKAVTSVLNAFLARRTDYLKNHSPDQLDLPENAPFDYAHFIKIPLDDPFWNDGFMCLSKDPWAVDPHVRSGIHAVLALDRSKEELAQLSIELRRTVSWGMAHRDQVKSCIDQCILGPMSLRLTDVLRNTFGEDGPDAPMTTFGEYSRTALLSGELEIYQRQHEALLIKWHATVNEMLLARLICREALPHTWFALMEFLESDVYNDDMMSGLEVDLILEEEVLNDQDSDGETAGSDDLDESHMDDLLGRDENEAV
ncbi:hypothetical protein PTTG_27253 [Puccinia triticina 1-1 BBBD Race 1]|uniref:CxC1 domain-containing protein n=1 Tax=Puccinia triticina (isolate 1-1 / race 1 (BBBD)) TaxID=630390 RepID=A0A180GMP2_PUCT1|nr:hypothetical protein PTTG_28598 [Puccinia triticina 1-1 BBBD Race 1]OAV93498.1 hypothetical protein PTTG_27293 [Puccinia triticina 1-1 BBBD Race 1]OAV93689.1 hypothetical protein PTTG_27253 [Puccinia triticina 1-1 BBBD Race 1]